MVESLLAMIACFIEVVFKLLCLKLILTIRGCHILLVLWLFDDMIRNIRTSNKIDGIDESFVQVDMDDVVGDIFIYSTANKVDGHLYVEHNVHNSVEKVNEPKCLDLDVGSNEEGNVFISDDDDVKGLRFDDSENGRTTAHEDGFELIEVEQPFKWCYNRVTINNKSCRIKICGSIMGAVEIYNSILNTKQQSI
jgi:hypothetical protein